jgi:alpha-beta hydrolase superfamily lysophospholipase
MRILNEKLDEFQEMPRNLSEPKMRYVPSPDLRPEALEEADEAQRQLILS